MKAFMGVGRTGLPAFFLMWCFTVQLSGTGSNLGIPFIQNYTQEAYAAGPQNWAITQDENGLLYIANDEGLLAFDGREWQLLPLPNRTIVRSLAMGEEGRIYIGGQDEVGYFQRDARGLLVYHSIKRLLPPEYQQFADVFDIVHTKDGVFFRASDRIYHLSEGKITVLPTQDAVLFLGAAQEEVYVQVEGQPLLRYEEGRLRPLSLDRGWPGNLTVMATLPFRTDSLLVATLRNGLFVLSGGRLTPFPTTHDNWLREKRIQCAALTAEGRIALGSVAGGFLLLDPSGKALEVISKEEGLQNPNVHSIFLDREQNLWLGLDYGIDYLLTSAPVRRIFPDGELEGTTYTAALYDNRLYCGTPNGLYAADWKSYYDPFENTFDRVANSNGQVWGLKQVEGSLLLGHDEGAFQIEGLRARRFSLSYGHWTFLPLEDHPGYALSGTYFGLEILRWENGAWRFFHKLEGLEESCRIIVRSPEGDIWVSHPYRGIYRVRLDDNLEVEQVKLYDQVSGLPSDLYNYLANINGEILVCGETGIFRYHEPADTFLLYQSLNNYFGASEQVRRLIEDPDGNIWFVTDQQVGVLKVLDKGLSKTIQSKQIIPELADRLVNRFEFIYFLDKRTILLGAEKGLIRYDPTWSARMPNPPGLPGIKGIFLADSLIARAYQPVTSTVRFSNDQNTFRFQFLIPSFNEMHPIEYQSRLTGWDQEWSEWSAKTEREYSNLSAGSYTFQVRARDVWGQVSETSAYTFSVEPPWYRTPAAYVVYTLLSLLFILGLVMVPRRRFQRERAKLMSEQALQAEEHERAARESEEKIIQLRNEKLKAEIHYKNKELASVTMHLVQKNELLNKLQTELRKVSKESQEKQTRNALRQLINLLKYDDQLDEDWNQFIQHFDQVHDDFFRRLREAFPILTPKDHKLCAYLRMNLSSKEIAPLLNISVRGVEISRYRLRKKLDLDSSINLTEYMMNF